MTDRLIAWRRYNSVNGVASCSNDFFNNQLMRKEWGLDGFVVSDCGEIRGLDSEDNHGTSAHPYTKQVNGSMSCQAALRGGCSRRRDCHLLTPPLHSY